MEPSMDAPERCYSEAEVREAVLRARDRQLAGMIANLLAVAVEYHPEEMRDALGKVLDLSAVQDSCDRQMLVLTDIFERANDAVSRCNDFEAQLQRCEENMAKLSRGLEACRDEAQWKLNEIARRLKAAKAYAADLEDQLRRHGFIGRSA